MNCPNCGGTNVKFKRESTNVRGNSNSIKVAKGIRIGNSNYKTQHTTIGLCQDCGYTWEPNKSHGILWWIFAVLFWPISLSIWFYKSPKVKIDKKWKILILVVFWIVFCIIGYAGDNEISGVNTEVTAQSQGNSKSEELENYYSDDDNINIFLNNYNKANPNNMINNFEKYYHHGQTHDDQIIYTQNGFEFVISGYKYIDNISIAIDGDSSKTNDDYKNLFIQYVKGYNTTIDDNTLNNYWEQVLNDLTNCVEFDDFECRLNIDNEKIVYMVLEGKVK